MDKWYHPEGVLPQNRTCAECGKRRCDSLYDDPRRPPLSTCPCLCEVCHKQAVEIETEDREAEIIVHEYVPQTPTLDKYWRLRIAQTDL